MFARSARFTILLTALLTVGQALVSKAATPSAPTNLSATSTSETTAALTWADNSTNENRFKIERSTNATTGFVLVGKTRANVASWTNTDLAPATTYYFRVYAFRRSNPPSAYTNVASITTPGHESVPPTTPTGLAASPMSCSRIDLTWEPSQDEGTGVAGYQIYRGGSVIGTTTSSSFSDSGLTGSTSFSYNVAAYDVAGNFSAMSVSAVASTPGCTTNQTPTAAAGPDRSTPTLSSIVFDGTGSRDADGSIASYTWSFGDGATGTGASVSHLYAHAGTYSVVLTVADNAGATASDTATVTVTNRAPVARAGADQTGTTGTVMTFSASGSSDSDGSIVSYSWAFGDGATASGLGASHAFAAPGTYTVTLTATDNMGASGIDTATTTISAAATVPSAPAGLTASAASSSRIDLGWSDTSSNETGFKVERGAAAAGPFTQIGTTGANATSYTDTGLGAGTAYYYRVRATNGTGDSGYSATAGATTQAGSSDTSAPTVPANIVTTIPVCGGIKIAWSGSTDSGSSGLKSYKVYRKNTFVGEVLAPETSFLDTGLPAAAYYYYFVSAVDNAGNESAKSSPVGVYTLSCVGSGGEYAWDQHSGGDLFPDDGQAVAADASGNTYVTGDFSATSEFGALTFTSAGSRDAFVAKYGVNGSIVWSKRFGGAYDDFGEGIAVDRSGNVFVTGKFQGTIDLGAGLTSAGGYDIFLAKLSGTDGRVIWAKRLGGVGADEGTSIAVDGNGDLFLTGQFFGTVDFGGGAVTNASSYIQAFIAKYAGDDGAHVWSRRMGKLLATAPTTVGSGRSVAVDPSGNPVITGYFGGPVDFGGGVLTSAGAMDVFVAKYSGNDGHALWTRRFGDASDQHATAVATDSSGDVVLTGDFLGAIDFGSGALPSSSGAQTIFLAKLGASDGSCQWARSFVAAGLNVGSYAWGVAVDGADDVLVTGQMSGPVDLGGGPLSNVGGVFAAKYGPTGVHQWSKNFRGGGGQGRGVAAGPNDRVVLTGAFDTVQDFGGGDVRSGGNTGTDLFVLSLSR